jgi:hypothetical protein
VGKQLRGIAVLDFTIIVKVFNDILRRISGFRGEDNSVWRWSNTNSIVHVYVDGDKVGRVMTHSTKTT